MLELVHLQVLSAALFSIGLYGVLARRSAVLVLISIELMLNAVNVNLIGLGAFADRPAESRVFGQILAIFVITISAAELGLAFAIILKLFRSRGSVNTDELNLMKW
ncbi:MAG: NADH-quinone oxidoreductase subunit NuoK [SAR202 cluster bacterium]|nr:NADH-quinone oxidoreductase subunit NuoK [SAR202 cluster bacterium]